MYKFLIAIFCLVASINVGAVESDVYPVVVIGSGAGGTMAAKRAVLNNRDTLLFTGAKKEKKRSRGYWVRKVDNVPGLEKYKRTIKDLTKATLKQIANSPASQYLTVVEDSVAKISKEGDLFVLKDKSGRSYRARHVIMATGMMDEQPHIKGSIKPILTWANKQLVCYCVLCDGHRSDQKKTAVIGYSENAAKNALILAGRYEHPKLTLLTNGHKPAISTETLAKLAEHKISIVTDPIREVVGNKSTKTLQGFKLDSGKLVEAEMGFISLGVRPNNALALQIGAETDAEGLVVTDANGETRVPNLYVVGDLRSGSMKQIYTAWQQAVEAVQLIDRRIRAEQ